ncbi:pentapeptide repeat-containing protein [Methylomonas koyamae]|uniref:pentapeptide repeat-containing protein n=1 Tax=Methylomonas koyamae TaxID=702114 RepID=UPI0006CFDA12|nr:pentapeptide repeat-containing protein [Methylomonas koyamae]
MLKFLLRVATIVALVLCCAAWMPIEREGACPRSSEQCPRSPECKISKLQLEQFLSDHQAWLEKWDAQTKSMSADGRPTLCNADLHGVNLNGAFLRQADLRGADLSESQLHGADLFGASMTKAYLHLTQLSTADLDNAQMQDANLTAAVLKDAKMSGADLSQADLYLADLRGAKLIRAKLTKAYLEQTRLDHADLEGADLKGAVLQNSVVDETILAYSDMTGATYSPQSASPNAFVAGIRGLQSLKFPQSREDGLVQLRELLKKSGHRELERQLTYALESGKTAHAIAEWSWRTPDGVEGVFRKVAFDWTTAYGMHPGRALLLIASIWCGLIPIYGWAMWRQAHFPRPRSGIYRIWPKDRLEVRSGGPTLDNPGYVECVASRGLTLVAWSAYFSLMSTFHFGFREFSIGNWLSRAQPRSFSLESTGWVRTVAGVQAMVSLYLLAICILTYFGRPFE